ncbi:MAG: DUF3318 domain-containing protein [Cyanothece sp. SIO1E1]|nr:DUF3318 domain-containing protein [Cyanothece sp. SIO1E1]
MDPSSEFERLMDIMPASGRMLTKIVSRPEQAAVVVTDFPRPWDKNRPLKINFDRWSQLSRPQRDLMLLRSVSWLTGFKLLKPDLYQGLGLAGILGTVVELIQGDAVGVLAAGGLSAIAGLQLWRSSRGPRAEIEADETAIRVAQRRGYTEVEAARHLLGAIETIARIEERPGMNFTELIRCQNLRAIAGISGVGVPENVRKL